MVWIGRTHAHLISRSARKSATGRNRRGVEGSWRGEEGDSSHTEKFVRQRHVLRGESAHFR